MRRYTKGRTKVQRRYLLIDLYMSLQIVKGHAVFNIDENWFELKNQGKVFNGYWHSYEIVKNIDGIIEVWDIEDFKKYISDTIVMEKVSEVIKQKEPWDEFEVEVMWKRFVIKYN